MQKDAYTLILEAIDAGVYKPGDRLVESELAERLGVSPDAGARGTAAAGDAGDADARRAKPDRGLALITTSWPSFTPYGPSLRDLQRELGGPACNARGSARVAQHGGRGPDTSGGRSRGCSAGPTNGFTSRFTLQATTGFWSSSWTLCIGQHGPDGQHVLRGRRPGRSCAGRTCDRSWRRSRQLTVRRPIRR